MSDWRWKNQVKKRDGYVCRRCGFDKNLHVHHILPEAKYPWVHDYPPNGLTLCGDCHSLLKGKEMDTDLRGFLPDDPKIDEQLKHLSENAFVNKSQQTFLEGKESQKINKSVKDKFLIANNLSDRGEHKEAIALYNDVIRLNSDFANAYLNRGKAKYELGQYKAAIYDYDRALSLKPDYVSAYFDRGLAKYALEQYQAVITDYDMVIRFTRDNVSAYFTRGLAKYKLERQDTAIIDFDEAIRLNPNFAKAYYYRGLAKYELGQRNAAIADFDEVNYLDPGFKRDSPYLKLAACEKSIRQNPKDALAYYYRGQANAELGQHDAAQIDYDTADWLSPRVRYDSLLREIFGRKINNPIISVNKFIA